MQIVVLLVVTQVAVVLLFEYVAGPVLGAAGTG